MKPYINILFLCLSLNIATMFKAVAQPTSNKPVRMAVAGITYGHAGFILGRKPKTDIELVGIYEPNK